MSDFIAFRDAVVARLKSADLGVSVYKQVTVQTAPPYVRVSPIASRRRELNAAGLVFLTTLRLYVETAKGRSEEAWILADKVARALDRQFFLLTPHEMTDLIVMQQASVVEIGLQQESIAIDIATTLLSGE